MTATAESRALVEAYFRAISENRPGDAWVMLADDAIWTVGGHSPLTGSYTKEQLAELTEKKIFTPAGRWAAGEAEAHRRGRRNGRGGIREHRRTPGRRRLQ